MKQLLMPLSLLITLMTGCDRQENMPIAAHLGGNSNSYTVNNTRTFTPADWTFEVNNGGNLNNSNTYQSTLWVSDLTAGLTLPVSATEVVCIPSRTVSYSLGIAATTSQDTTSFCYWYCQLVPPATLRVGDVLTLKARIRVDQVQGQGVTLMIRDDTGNPISSLCGERRSPTVTGTADFTDYSFTLPYTNPGRHFRVYLLMRPQTTGTVTFSDMSLRIN